MKYDMENNRQRSFFENGGTLSYESRKQALMALKTSVKKNEPDILAALKKDLGKSAVEAYMTEIGIFYSDISFDIKNLKKWMKPKKCGTPMTVSPAKSWILQSPYGVVLIISPWNYPFLLTFEPLAAALAAGNCCVVKPSELAPETARVMTRLLAEALPEELVRVVNGGAEECRALLEERFDYIFYTGNTSVGRYVMEKASAHLTPVTLELGGKSPVIITRSANLALAARRIAFGKFLNLGQTCVAPDYVLIEQEVHDDFLQLLKKEIFSMYGTDPLLNEAYGKIINRRHFDRICQLIDKDKVVFGGETNEASLKIAPTVMDGVKSTDAVMNEEIFGPVLPVLAVNNLDEAFRFVQERPHPLALYLFTEKKHDVQVFMHGLQFGGGCVNDVVVHLSNPNLPFGGIGESGMGFYHGSYSFRTFSHPKAILKSSTRIDMPMRYQPITVFKEKLIRMFMK